MIQNTFVDPTTTVPAPGVGNVGNGSMSAPVVSSATLSESFTVVCAIPGGANVGQFSVTGSVSGLIGTATSNVEFIDANKKVRFTITAGATPWAVDDNFTFDTTAGAPMNKANFDAHATQIAAKNEANTFTANQTMQKSDPVLILDDTAAGSTTGKIHFSGDSLYIRTNENETLDEQNDATKPSWAFALETTADTLTIYRRPAGGAFSSIFGLNNTGKMTVGIVPLARIDGFTASVTFDFPSIAAQGNNGIDITVIGAAMGDFVLVSASIQMHTAIVLSAAVKAADTVEIRLQNTSAFSVDPANATYYVKVIKKDF